MTTTGERAPGRADPSALGTRRGVAALLAATVGLVTAYAGFMVPLLRAGLADAPMVTFRDPGAATYTVGGHVVPDVPGLADQLYLVWFATIALGPLLAAAGMLASGWVAVRAARAGRAARAAVSVVTSLACTGVLTLALSPWGRTAKVWLLD